jgi:hypothetical protein
VSVGVENLPAQYPKMSALATSTANSPLVAQYLASSTTFSTDPMGIAAKHTKKPVGATIYYFPANGRAELARMLWLPRFH